MPRVARVCLLLCSLWACGALVLAQPSASQSKAAQALVLESQDLMRRGDYPNAREVLLRAVKLDPKNPFAFCNLGRACYNTLDRFSQGIDEAERYLKRSIELDPQLSDAYAHLAEIRTIQSKFADAVVMADKGIRCKSPHADCYYYKAIALSNLKKGDEALATIDKYISLGSPGKLSQSLEAKASILENMGRYKDALAVYDAIYKSNKQDTYIYRQASCLEKMGTPLKAALLLDKLIASNPHDEVALVQRARLFVKAGEYKRAESDYTRAIDEVRAAAYLKERAALYKKMGKLDLYQKDMKAAEEL